MSARGPTRALARGALAIAFGVPFGLLWARSPFGYFLPPEILVPGLTAGWLLALPAGLLAFLVAGRHTAVLAWTLGVASALLVLLLYPHASLDWSRLLKDWDLVGTGLAWPLALALAVIPLFAAWGLHVTAHERALVTRFHAKGVPQDEVDAVAHRARHTGRAVAGAGVGAVAVLAAAHGLLAPLVRVLGDGFSRAPFLVPVLAVGAIAAVLALLLAHRARADA